MRLSAEPSKPLVIGFIRINGLMVGGINDPAHSAKKILLNPNLNVSEVPYIVGLESLTDFNRIFRRRLPSLI